MIKRETGELHAGPGVSIPGFHCRGLGSILVSELRSSRATEHHTLAQDLLSIWQIQAQLPGSQVSSKPGQGTHHSSLNSAFSSKHWVSSTSKPSLLPSPRGWIVHSALSTSRVHPVFLYLEAAFLIRTNSSLTFLLSICHNVLQYLHR